MKILYTIITLFLFSAISNAQQDDRGYLVNIGQMAPDFTLNTTDGRTFKLSDQRGKVVMLQFTASWCGVCRKEMPHIENEIWLPLKDKDFVLIGLDRDEPNDVVDAFSAKMKITYPLAPDPGADVFALYADRKAGITRNVIIDRDGKIVFLTRLFDEKEFNAMKDKIYELLGMERPEMDVFNWLTGTWAKVENDQQFFETWSKENDSLFKAFSYMTVKGDTVFSENIVLTNSGPDVYYTVSVNDQGDGKAVSFRLNSTHEGRFIFENPEHDFPQRIIYQHPTPDSLHAKIEGYIDGMYREENFSLKQVNK